MKTLRPLVLVLGALCSAAGLSAQSSHKTSAPNPNDHDDLKFNPTPIVREFTDQDTGKKVTATWKWTNEEGLGANRCDIYTCSIHQDAPPVNGLGYSLYNLEVQGRRWEVEVISTTGNPQFILRDIYEKLRPPLTSPSAPRKEMGFHVGIKTIKANR